MEENVKKALLLLLDKFVEVCNQNGLQYYLDGGTVLGAVRHKGFIPWDDDIDVQMPREDYEKLQTLPDEVWGENMRLATWKKTKNYTYDFLKLELTNTTVIERLHPDYIGGIFLDVFPIDHLSNSSSELSIFEDKLRGITKRYVECTIKNDNECESIWELMGMKLKRVFYNHKNQMEKWEKLVASYSGMKSYVCSSHSYIGTMPSSWFQEGILLEFEGKNYIVPLNYDAYLSYLYGDYMLFPPLEKRYGHVFMYVNLDKRISQKEAKIVFKFLHNKYKYHFSIKRELKYVLKRILK